MTVFSPEVFAAQLLLAARMHDTYAVYFAVLHTIYRVQCVVISNLGQQCHLASKEALRWYASEQICNANHTVGHRGLYPNEPVPVTGTADHSVANGMQWRCQLLYMHA